MMSEVPPPDWAALYQQHRDAMYRVAARVLRGAGPADEAGDAVSGGYGVVNEVAAGERAELAGRSWRRVSSAPKADRLFAKCQLPEEGIPR
jgi:hypothetical protein